MAGVNAPAPLLGRPGAYERDLAAPSATAAVTREKMILLVSIVVALALFTIGALNLAGAISTPLIASEGAGANPAIDYFVFGSIVILGPFGFAETARIRRIQKIEERLPDFLRDVAEAGRFGMTLPDAIIVAARGRYGLLTDEIKRMASQLEWGVPVATALRLFEERVPTPLVQRVVSIIARANDAGGNVADVLTMVAHDTKEGQNQIEGRNVAMSTYVAVIYISFGVFLVTILIMASVFLPQMVLAGQGIASSGLSSSGSNPVSLNFNLVPDLFIAFFIAVIVHAIGDGIMAGVLFRGRIAEGMQHATVMLLAGWVTMRFFVPSFTG